MTKRELEVAMLAATGITNQQIAEQLGIAPGTVRVTLHKIFQDHPGVERRYQLEFLLKGSRV